MNGGKKRGIEYKEGINEQRGREGTSLKKVKEARLRTEERTKNMKGLSCLRMKLCLNTLQTLSGRRNRNLLQIPSVMDGPG